MNKTKPGSTFGGMMLIAGSCVGAGMLGLPIKTGLAGIGPSLVTFFVAWGFMLCTAFLLVEIADNGRPKENIISMAGRTLGTAGKTLSWVLYLFLFYALLVAYISASGNLMSFFLRGMISEQVGSLFFVLLFGLIVYLGTRHTDVSNRALMVGKIAAFVCLLAMGVSRIDVSNYARAQFGYAALALPLLIISFGFHNMIPSVVNYMKGDIERVKKVLLGGSLFALILYLIWDFLVLGILPLDGEYGIADSLANDHGAAETLVRYSGAGAFSIAASLMGFFTILTSFLAQALGMVHFLSDGLNIKQDEDGTESPLVCLMALAPPLILSFIFPNLFYAAIDFAGGICTVILFGILPVMMVWKQRAKHPHRKGYHVPFGKPLLVVIFLLSVAVLCFQLATMMGFKL